MTLANTKITPIEPVELTALEFKQVLQTGKCDKIDCLQNGVAVIDNVVVKEHIVLSENEMYPIPIGIKDGKFSGGFIISGGEFSRGFWIEGGEFSGDDFSGGFKISGGEFSRGFRIEGGEFSRGFIISGGEFSGDEFSGDEFSGDFWIEDGDFSGGFKISGGEFSRGFRIEGGEFSRGFIISGGEFSGSNFSDGFWISGGEFSDGFRIDGGEFLHGFRIESGEFSDGFWISDGDFSGGFIISGGKFSRGFRISGGKFSGSFWIDGGEFLHGFRIESGKFSGGFIISGGEFSRDFKISGGDFSDSFRISGGDFPGDFRIESGKFSRDFRIESGKFSGGFIISGGEFLRGFWIDGGEFSHGFWIEDGKFSDDFRIEGGEFSRGFRISGGDFSGSFRISGGDFPGDFNINSRNVINKLHIGSVLMKLKIDTLTIQSEIKELIIKNDKEILASISKLVINRSPNIASFINLNLNSLIISDHDSSGNFAIQRSRISQLHIENFNNFGKITFNSLKPPSSDVTQNQGKSESEIIISNSDLGLTNFISCSLDKYKFQVDNSKLVGIFYTDTAFPEEILTRKKDFKKKYHQLRDTYDQLQTVATKQGDKIIALDFQAKSLDYYRSSLNFLKGRKITPSLLWKRKKRILPLLWQNRKWLLLKLMQVSNDNRQSSLIALVFILVTGLFFFSFYALAIRHPLHFGYPDVGTFKDWWTSTGELIGYFPEFLNPTHKVDYIQKPVSIGWAYTFDFFGKIAIGFGIYQLIQAFRRFGKGGGGGE